MLELFRLDNKVAIITGATGSLGSAIAQGMSSCGAKVGILGRSEDKIEKLVEQINDKGGQALGLRADVLNEADLRSAHSKLFQTWGRVDILINVAGGNMSGATIGPEQTIFDLSIADFDKVVALNLKGTLLPTMIFGESMAKNNEGVIINISSMAAQQPLTRVVGYGAAKAAIDNFTKWLSVEMALKFGEGIRVNAIAPGFFLGEQNKKLLTNADGSLTSRAQTIVNHTPMKRFGEPHELIGTTVWLSSEAAKFVTGVVVPVDGGFSAFSGI